VEGDMDTTVTEKSQTALALAGMVLGSYFSMLGARTELGLVLALADEPAATLGLELPLARLRTACFKNRFGLTSDTYA
jgi:hypothetical protein